MRGSVGGHVFQNGVDGQTIMREKKDQIKNPKTQKQVAQRIIFATVAQAAKLMKPIINHSYEGVAYGNKSIREFRKRNLNYLRNLAALDFADSSKGADARVFMTTRNVQALIPNKYIISTGSLAPCNIIIAKKVENSIPHLAIKVPGIIVPITNNKLRIGDLITAVYGISNSDEQITLVTINKSADGFKYALNNDPEVPGWAIPYTTMNAKRLVVDNTFDFNEEITVTVQDGEIRESATLENRLIQVFDPEKSDASLLDYIEDRISWAYGDFSVHGGALDANGNGYIDEVESAEERADYVDLGTIYGVTETNTNGAVYAAALVRSRYNNGDWLRSESSMLMIYPLGYDSSDIKKLNFGLDWNAAPQAWDQSVQVAEDDRFLNEGGTGGQVGE